MAHGLPDPTAAMEAHSAAGGCPLSELLDMRLRAICSSYFYAVAGSLFFEATSPFIGHGLLDATAE